MDKFSAFKPAYFLTGGLLVAGLYASSLYNYLLFHTLIELFNVLTAFAIFALAWNTRRINDNHYLLFLGIASLFTGALDLLHAVAYKGMGVFPDYGANLATELWIAFRFLFSASFLAAAFFIRRKPHIGKTFILYTLVLSALIVSIFEGWFPDCFIEGRGLTRFKIVSEYVICLIFLASLALLILKRQAFDASVLRLMVLSHVFSIASEVSFTQYASVYDFSNMLGHLFLLGSVFCIYQAIVVTGMVEPSRLLFRNLKLSEEAIRASETRYRLLFQNMANGFAYHRIVCDDRGRPVDYIFLEVNSAFEALTGLKASVVIGKSVRDVLPGIEADPADWIGVFGRVAQTGQSVRLEQHAAGLGKWYSVSAYSPVPDHFVAVFEDITERKIADDALRRSNQEIALANGILEIFVKESGDRMYDKVLDLVLQHMESRYGVFGYIDEQGVLVCPTMSRIFDKCEIEGKCIRYTRDKWKGLWSRALLEKKTLFSNDQAVVPRGHMPIRNNMAVPILFQNEVIGLFNLADRDSGYTDEDRLFLEAVTDRIAPVLYAWIQKEMRENERKRAEEEIRHSMRRFELLAQTSDRLLQTSEPQKIVESLCKNVMEHLDCHVFFNFFVDEQAGRLHLNACAGISGEEARRIEWLDFGVAVCGCVARDASRIVAERIQASTDERTELVKSYGVKAYACHPIIGPAGKVLGTLSFGSRTRDMFPEEDLSLMKAVTDQVAVAMIRMRDEQALRTTKDELEIRVRERTAELAAANDELEREVGVRRMAEQGLRLSEERFRTSIENLLDGFALFSAVRDKAGIITDFRYEYINQAGCEMNGSSREDQVGRTLLELQPGRESKLFTEYVAVVQSGRPLAMSNLLSEDANESGPRLSKAYDLQAVKMGDGFAVVWRDVSERRETERRVSLTNELLKLYTQKFSRREYLDVAVQLIRDWSGCRHAGIRIADPDGNIPYESCVGFNADFLSSEKVLSIKHDECICIRVSSGEREPSELISMTPNESVYSNDALQFVDRLTGEQRSRYRGVCMRFGFKSLAVVPVKHRDTILGAIHIADERPGMVPLANVEFVEKLAFIVGEALFRFGVEEDLLHQREELVRINEQLRNLSAHVDAVREGERTSIAREIHDELGQVLTAVKMDVSWLRNRLTSLGLKLAEKAGETIAMIDGAIQSVKRISSDLRPGVLDDIGLAAAIEWAAKDFQKRTGIGCTVSFEPESLIVDRMRSTALFRIFQESLTNIMRHAEASQVTVSLSEKNKEILLSVSDNGKGIRTEELGSPYSFGLIGMRERVQFLHGAITIQGAPNRGTTVTVALPVNAEKEQPMTGHAAREGAFGGETGSSNQDWGATGQ